jgi:hypothetical protein
MVLEETAGTNENENQKCHNAFPCVPEFFLLLACNHIASYQESVPDKVPNNTFLPVTGPFPQTSESLSAVLYDDVSCDLIWSQSPDTYYTDCKVYRLESGNHIYVLILRITGSGILRYEVLATYNFGAINQKQGLRTDFDLKAYYPGDDSSAGIGTLIIKRPENTETITVDYHV